MTTFYMPWKLVNLAMLVIVLTSCGSKYVQPTQFTSPVKTYQGMLSSDGKVTAFLGIPFAQPPIGKMRWRAPQPLRGQKSGYHATRFAPACMQGKHMEDWYRDVMSSFGGDPKSFSTPEISEDCLYLNIWRPVTDTQDPLPVLVFIHGGSNKGGWSYEPNYIGEQLAQRGIIVITVAYRLGVFGFFDHPQLMHSNFALLDQLAALRWIKHNIHRFGGDRHQITISGESAGANNIDSLLASPLAQDLFQKIIHQSGGSVLNARTTKAQHAVLGRRLADTLLGTHHATPIKAMRQLSAKKVLNAAEEIYADHYFDPVIDGHSVVKPLRQALEENEFLAVDLMIGTNADEWLMYLEKDQTVAGWLAENVPVEKSNSIAATLDPSKSSGEQLDTLITGYNFVCPSMTLAQAVARRGGNTWMYYFSRQRSGKQAATMGAYHGAELPYVFNTHDDWLPTDADDRRLTQAMMRYWAQFVKSGDPNVPDLPVWFAYNKPGDFVQVLDADITHQIHSSQALCSVMLP